MLQALYRSGPMDANMGLLKKYFSILTLLPPQTKVIDQYNGYIKSINDIEVDNILDKTSEKRASMRKKLFVKGKQDNIEECVSLIANIMVYARYWVKMDPNIYEYQPLIIQLLVVFFIYCHQLPTEISITILRMKECVCMTPWQLISLTCFLSLLIW